MSSMDNRTPLIRLAKRSEMSPRKIWAIRVCSIIVALILGCIPMMLTGNNPVEAYGVIIQGSVSRPVYLKQSPYGPCLTAFLLINLHTYSYYKRNESNFQYFFQTS